MCPIVSVISLNIYLPATGNTLLPIPTLQVWLAEGYHPVNFSIMIYGGMVRTGFLPPPQGWPQKLKIKQHDLPEMRRVLSTTPPPDDITVRFSSYQHMLRVIAWCRRSTNKEKPTTKTLLLREILETEKCLIKQVQQIHYPKEI